MTKNVALQKCFSYDFDEVFSAVKKMMQDVPPPDVRGKTILIKPNILYPKKVEACVCTNPVVTGALVKAFKELGAKKVLAGESPAVANSTSAAKATGTFEQVVSNGGEWIDFHGKVFVENPEGVLAKKFEFADAFAEADVIVSAAKLKSHQLMKYTGAMKNLFGLVVGLEKAQCHYRFSNPDDFGKFLVDLNLAAKPQYAVMDAVMGMDGPGGPGSGDPIQLNFLAASDNILALDWICSSLVGYNPHEINYLQDALLRKVWLSSAEEIQTLGADFREIACDKFRTVKSNGIFGSSIPSPLKPLAKFFLTRNPHFKNKKCIKCARCEKICPAKVIAMQGKNGTARMMERTKCLHCFCCHEICPESAISLRRFIW